MSDSVQTDFVANDKEMLAAYRRMQKECEKYKKMLSEAGQAHKKEADDAEQAAKKKIKAQQEWLANLKKTDSARVAAELRAKQALIDHAAATKSSSEIAATALKSNIVALGATAAGYFAIQTAVQAVTRFYGAWAAEIDKVAEANKDLHVELVKTLSSGQDVRNAPQIEKALKGVRGMSPMDATAAFAAATGAAPGMEWKKRLDIVKESSPLSALGHDMPGQTSLAAKIANLDPTITAKQASNMALSMRQRAGEDASKLGSDEFMANAGRMIKAGLPTNLALGISMAGVESDLPTKSAKGIADAIFESDPTAGHRGPMTAAQKAQRAFSKLSGAEKWKALQNKQTAEAVLGAGGALNVAFAGDAMAQVAAIGGDSNAIQSTAAAFAENTGVKSNQAESLTERVRVAKGERMARANALRKTTVASMEAFGMNRNAAGLLNAELYVRSQAAEMHGVDPEAVVQLAIDKKMGQFAEMITKAMAHQTKALEANTKATLENTPKAKKAVDNHNERHP